MSILAPEHLTNELRALEGQAAELRQLLEDLRTTRERFKTMQELQANLIRQGDQAVQEWGGQRAEGAALLRSLEQQSQTLRQEYLKEAEVFHERFEAAEQRLRAQISAFEQRRGDQIAAFEQQQTEQVATFERAQFQRLDEVQQTYRMATDRFREFEAKASSGLRTLGQEILRQRSELTEQIASQQRAAEGWRREHAEVHRVEAAKSRRLTIVAWGGVAGSLLAVVDAAMLLLRAHP